MSSEEKKRIEEYKRLRFRWIIIQLAIIVLLGVMATSFFLIHNDMNQTYYINYTESSDVDYRIYYTDNSYFDDYVDEKMDIVASLVDYIKADFKYNINVDAEKAKFQYSFEAYADLFIVNEKTNNAIWNPRYELIGKTQLENNSNQLNLTVPVEIDFNKYNNEVKSFLKDTNLIGVKSYVNVSVAFNVISTCENQNDNNKFVVTLMIPLNENIIDIKETNSVPTEKVKNFLCESSTPKNAFLVLAIVSTILDAIGIVVFVSFIYLTRNTYINYEIKVKKIVNAYKSFIHKINNVFDTKGYQVLLVNSIEEMLDIRDTLQSPILMSENEDKTVTQFIIPANNQILYIYEVKIDNYDEIYGNHESEVIVESEPIIISEEELEENIVVEEVNNFNQMQYAYSFEAKLTLSKEEVQNFYKEIIKYIKEYGVKVSRSFKRERVYQGKTLFANLIYRGKTLCVLFPLDANDAEYAKYKLIDISQYKKYSNTPSLIKITSARRVKYVIEILGKLFSKNNVKNENLTIEVEKIKKKSKLTLIKEGLIRKINKN